MVKYIFSLIIFLSGLTVNATNYYVKNGGNDSNTGLSDEQAWATLGKADDVTFAPGDTLFFARGSTWKEAFVPRGDGTSGSPVVFTAYGTGAKPRITARDTVNGWSDPGQWTRPWDVTRPNVWYNAEARTPLFWTAIRMWFDGVEKERPQTFPPTAAKPWYWHEDDSLFVYSTTNPATAFTSIEKATSFYGGFTFDTDNYFTLSYLDIEHFYICVLIDDSDGIVIDSCDIKGYYGVNIYASVDSRDGEIKNCKFDTESNFISGWEAKYTLDGIKVGGVSNNWLIHDNYFKNWAHTSITLESTDEDRVDSCKVYDNEITAPDIDYGGQLAVLYINGDGNEIYRNYIHNIQVRNQVQGENVKWYYNIIDTVNAPSWYPKNLNAGGGFYIAGLSGGTANNMKFYNNIIANCEDYGIGLIHGETYEDKYDNVFFNNIIYNCDDTAIYISGGATVLNNTFKNNLIYTPGQTLTIYYKGAPNIPVASWNTSDTGGDIISGNLSYNPNFETGGFALLSTSPAINAGFDVDLTTDYLSNAIIGLPDIGAYEYQYPTLSTTGLGWEPALSKRNFKGEANLSKGKLLIDGVAITATAEQLSSVNSKAPLNNPSFTNSITVAGDTTVTAVIGKIVYQAADSSFYGCRSTVAPKKWYKLND